MNRFDNFKSLVLDKASKTGIRNDDNSFESSLISITEKLFPHVSEMVNKSERDLRNSFKGIFFLNSPSIQGYVESNDAWKSWTININEGMWMFYYKMLKVVVTVAGHETSNGKKIKSHISFEESLYHAKKLMTAFWQGEFGDTHSFRLKDLSGAQMLFGALLHKAIMGFIVGHELGHIVQIYSKEKLEQYSFAETNVRNWLKEVELSDQHRNEFVVNWSQEIAADLIGTQLLLKCSDLLGYEDSLSGYNSLFAYIGCELMLNLLDMLMCFGEKYYSHERINFTHPPATIRMQAIRFIAKKSNMDSTLFDADGLHEFIRKITAAI